MNELFHLPNDCDLNTFIDVLQRIKNERGGELKIIIDCEDDYYVHPPRGLYVNDIKIEIY